MHTTEIRAVIFDWGGVLINDPLPELIRSCSEKLGVSKEAFNAAQAKFLPEFQVAKVSEAEFWEKITTELGVTPPTPPTLWGDVFKLIYSPRPEVFAWVTQLQHAGIATAVLSNTEAPNATFFQEQTYDMFDVRVFSCLEGTRKPESRIYEIALGQVKTKPEETIYLDDVAEYATAAEKLGIHGHQAQSAEEIRKMLRSYNLPIT